jgi:hypothetical protein
VEEFSVNPGGSVPVLAHVSVPNPPFAPTVIEYELFSHAAVNTVRVMVNGTATVMAKACVADVCVASVTVTEPLKAPVVAAVGVPEITPLEDMVSPAGNVAFEKV